MKTNKLLPQQTAKFLNILTREVLIDLYINKEFSLAEIAKKYNVCASTVHNYIKKYNISTRSVREATKLGSKKRIGITCNRKYREADLSRLRNVKEPEFKSNDLYRHYLRGLFDADGCVSFGKNRNYAHINLGSANEHLILGCSNLLKNNYIKHSIDIHHNNKGIFYLIRILKESFYNFYLYLYQESSNLYLKRKKDKFDKLCVNYNLKIVN